MEGANLVMSIPRGVAEKILSPVPQDMAFHFYGDIDRPLGTSATSLNDFGAKLKSLDLTSVEFHTKRGDFEKWIYMLGDPELVKGFMKARESNLSGQKLRGELVRLVQTRLRQLKTRQSKK
jgi:hypothetical protein